MIANSVGRTAKSNGVRSFVSIEIPRPIREKIVMVPEPLKHVKGKVGWSNANNLHITLKFLGDCTRGRLEAISKKLADIAARHKPFELSFEGIGLFPGPSKPRIIWLGIERGRKQLEALAEDVDVSMDSIGFKREAKRFRPHITLGRVKFLSSVTELKSAMDRIPKVTIEPMLAEHIFLMRSQLNPKGAVYTIIERLFFTGGEERSRTLDESGWRPGTH